ncbi:methyl-accepting chemotaxis protein [Bacillus sp. T33-2]|uniref:methyl-accepting chemotaxis protein n=1 Tax=Bacillus sp. T33-2 TaxID=2054168 RepID=UPI000C77FA18|nr:methyl-accepting chemotaxis protein [Bacillus sp. T33-2]PLR94849.1 chemotaxis protein [Bacillus sp. T33-2]
MNNLQDDQELDRDLHPKLAVFIELAPLMKDLFPQDFAIGVSDREKLLLGVGSETVPPLPSGYVLQQGDGLYEAVRYGKVQKAILPKEVFGFPVQANAIPLQDNTGHVFGAVGVASSLEQYNNLFDIASKLSVAVEQVTATIQELAGSVTSFSGTMQYISEQSNSVSRSVQDIEKVAKMVREVSDHSQILGLNASIEAARAGEFGKGFSIVAQEIRKMAGNSKEHTETIRSTVTKIEELILELHKSVTKSNGVANTQSAAIEELAVTMQEISQNASTLAEYAERIIKGEI